MKLYGKYEVKVESGASKVEDQGTLENSLLSEAIVLIPKLINNPISVKNILAANHTNQKIFSMGANW